MTAWEIYTKWLGECSRRKRSSLSPLILPSFDIIYLDKEKKKGTQDHISLFFNKHQLELKLCQISGEYEERIEQAACRAYLTWLGFHKFPPNCFCLGNRVHRDLECELREKVDLAGRPASDPLRHKVTLGAIKWEHICQTESVWTLYLCHLF